MCKSLQASPILAWSHDLADEKLALWCPGIASKVQPLSHKRIQFGTELPDFVISRARRRVKPKIFSPTFFFKSGFLSMSRKARVLKKTYLLQKIAILRGEIRETFFVRSGLLTQSSLCVETWKREKEAINCSYFFLSLFLRSRAIRIHFLSKAKAYSKIKWL